VGASGWANERACFRRGTWTLTATSPARRRIAARAIVTCGLEALASAVRHFGPAQSGLVLHTTAAHWSRMVMIFEENRAAHSSDRVSWCVSPGRRSTSESLGFAASWLPTTALNDKSGERRTERVCSPLCRLEALVNHETVLAPTLHVTFTRPSEIAPTFIPK